MDNEIKITTRFNTDRIEQEVQYPGSDLIASKMKQVLNLQDQGIREALIKLGWAPPKAKPLPTTANPPLYIPTEEQSALVQTLRGEVEAASRHGMRVSGFGMSMLEDIIRLGYRKVPSDMRPAGVPIGLNDKHGNPVHIGDTLRFDPQVWGNDTNNKFVVELADGEIQTNGVPSDIPNWCEIIKRWNED